MLFLTGLPWDFRGARRQQFAARLAEAPEVAGVLHGTPLDRASIVDAARRRLGLRARRRSLPGIFSTGTLPLYPPEPLRAVMKNSAGPIYRAARRWTLRRQLSWRGGVDVVYISHPMHAPVLDECHDRVLTVFDWTDDFACFASLPADEREALAGATSRILSRVDLVLTVSRRLHERARAVHPHVERLPNATDLQCEPADGGRPDPLGGIPKPRLGYVGQLANRIDYALLHALAEAEPRWSLVFVGPVWPGDRAPAEALARRPNVHLLGPREHAELPGILSRFDVCLLPHTVDALTETMDPIKLYDYLASGRPIVSTPVAGTERFADAIHVAASPGEFREAVRRALARPEEHRERRLALAAANSWDLRAAELLDHLRAAWMRKHAARAL
jgi:glycosyltransferase involved in cell wall biosynthesis